MRNHFKTWMLLGTLGAVFVAIGGMLGKPYMITFAVVAVASNFAAYWFSDRLVLAIHRGQEIAPKDDPFLHDMAEELAERAGIPKPRLYVIDEDQPNAFATGRNPEHGVIAVTQGLVKYIPACELRGILAHEMAHIRNQDTLVASVAATVVAAISYASQALSFAWLFGGRSKEEESPTGGLAALFVSPFIGFLLQMAVSRSREYLADETAARLTGEPGALASALLHLERRAQRTMPGQMHPAAASLYIVNPFAGLEAVSSLFSTHPATRLRVARLAAMMSKKTQIYSYAA
jgi:heat shock protein HtpX